MIHQEFNFHSHQTDFYGEYWQPTTVTSVVVFVHGIGEHLGRYTHLVIPKLLEANFGVIAFDQFGHGKTTGKRGHNPGFNAVLESVDKVCEKAIEVFGEKSLFLYGHSMGGNVVVNYALRKPDLLKGVIATSPFLKLAFQPPYWKIALGKLMQKIAPSVTLNNEIKSRYISRIPKEVEEYDNDPLVHNRISANYSLTFIDTGIWAIENATTLEIPMLLLHGTSDRITSCEASEAFAKKSDKISLKLYKGAYHELHNDLCRKEMIADVIEWLEKISG